MKTVILVRLYSSRFFFFCCCCCSCCNRRHQWSSCDLDSFFKCSDETSSLSFAVIVFPLVLIGVSLLSQLAVSQIWVYRRIQLFFFCPFVLILFFFLMDHICSFSSTALRLFFIPGSNREEDLSWSESSVNQRRGGSTAVNGGQPSTGITFAGFGCTWSLFFVFS